MNDCPRGKLALARRLAEKLEVKPVPILFNWNQTRGQAIAELRHIATNYDAILGDLDYYCLKCLDANRLPCPVADQSLELDQECYRIIKTAANELAETLYIEHKP